MKKFLENHIYTIMFVLICYNAGVMTYQKFSNTRLTQTELFLLMPSNWILKFK